MDLSELPASLLAGRPHLFSTATVAVSTDDMARMQALVAAVEYVVALPAYHEHVLAWAPEIARYEPRGRGVFFGYDFHLTEAGPQLIEINTNAGGGFLVAARLGDAALADTFVEMFSAECGGVLRTVAIVDERATEQFLYPEFLLCKELFKRHGIETLICDPQDLMLCHGGLWHEQTRLDLVYNRLTDFALAAPENAALRQAYLDGVAVVTPSPRAHALYADKRNLAVLSDRKLLEDWDVAPEIIDCLVASIPRTQLVSQADGDDLWARRRGLFFKPAGGYGSKAAYRGDKLTRRVFEEVLAGSYVAQVLAPPSTVPVTVDGAGVELKADIRCYAYRGQVQLTAARLWQGQTTNFRTPGGGFAKVVVA